MKAAANSSVLIALSAIGKLDLLASLFPEGILVPPAVWREVVEMGRGRPGAAEVSSAGWIQVRRIENEGMASVLRSQLDAGEAEAIVLAVESKPDVILLDERDARRVAAGLGIPFIGTVGILVEARKRGKIASLREALDALTSKAGFRLRTDVMLGALKATGEQ